MRMPILVCRIGSGVAALVSVALAMYAALLGGLLLLIWLLGDSPPAWAPPPPPFWFACACLVFSSLVWFAHFIRFYYRHCVRYWHGSEQRAVAPRR